VDHREGWGVGTTGKDRAPQFLSYASGRWLPDVYKCKPEFEGGAKKRGSKPESGLDICDDEVKISPKGNW